MQKEACRPHKVYIFCVRLSIRFYPSLLSLAGSIGRLYLIATIGTIGKLGIGTKKKLVGK